jgi:hypothetical protein
MQYSVENVLQVQEDLLGLLGFELELQKPMVEKIWGFMARSVHRTILDMRSLRRSKQLEDVWCSSSIRPG